jgi:hypothetical protein
MLMCCDLAAIKNMNMQVQKTQADALLNILENGEVSAPRYELTRTHKHNYVKEHARAHTVMQT